MRKILFSIICLLYFGNYSIQAQTCGTETSIAVVNNIIEQVETSPNIIYTTSLQPTQVPVTAHIIRRNNGTRGLTAAQLRSALATTNTYFRNAGIEFFLCGDIDYINNTSLSTFDKNTDENYVYSRHYTPNTINIYFADQVQGSSGNSLCGYAYYPGGRDIVVMQNGCTLNGSTLSHELGHYFNLIHTHGRSNSRKTDELVNGSNCSNTGDLVCDTPADPNISGKVSNCAYNGSERDANRHRYQPNARNFMSYSIKQCRNHFTNEQYTRMYQTLVVERNYLQCNDSKDRCDDVQTIQCGTTINSSTISESNDFNRNDYSHCYFDGSSFDGKDKLFKVTVSTTANLKIKLSNLNEDLDLFLFDGCGRNMDCIGTSLNSHTSNEEIVINNARGTYYIVVDGYRQGESSSFRLSVDCVRDECEIYDNFDSYRNGDGVSWSNSSIWKKWSSSSPDGIVSRDRNVSDRQSMEINRNQYGAQDVILKLGNRSSGLYKVSWYMYINNGDKAYYNIQNNYNGLEAGGVFGGLTFASSKWKGFWFKVELYFDLNQNIMKAYANGEYLMGRNYHANLGGINFYAIDDAHYYVDNVCLKRVSTIPLTDGEATSSSRSETADIGVVINPTITKAAAVNNTLKVFPNPTNGQATITMELPSAEPVSLSIFNQTGQLVQQTDIGNIDFVNEQIDLSDLPNGLYLIRIEGASFTSNHKVVKQ